MEVAKIEMELGPVMDPAGYFGGAGRAKRARFARGARVRCTPVVSMPVALRQGSGGAAPGKFLGDYTF